MLLNTVHNELPTISGKVTSIHDAMQHLTVTSKLTEEQWQDYCLAALFLTDPYIDRNELTTAKGQRVQGTCQWITTNETYASWLASQSQLLWLSGGPGKGKTMLSIFLTEELEKIVVQSQDAKLAYFFCDNRNKKRNTAVAMLRGLIFQLIQQHSKLLEHILPVFKVQKEALFSDSSFESLWRIFESMVRDPGIDSVFCVLDGLDECDEHSLEMLTEKLRDFFSKSPMGLKLVAVSRELPDCIPRAISGFPRVRLDPDSDREVSNDLREFIMIKVNELSTEKFYPDDLRAYVERTLLERAKGTFLWVGFVIKELRKKAPAEVEDCLNDLPAGLGGMYGRLLLDIREERRKKIAVSILCWVTMAVRPLTLTELGAATKTRQSGNLSVKEVIRDHIGFCGYMLTVTGNNVGLVHQSAKDYLLRKDPDPNPQLEFFRVKEKKTNSEIAQTCFNYLHDGALADGSVQLVERYSKAADTSHLQAFPLLSYAVLHWPEHARYSDNLAEDIFDLSIPFYKKNSLVREAWLTTYWAAKEYGSAPSSFSLLHLASFFGLVPLTRKLLKKGWKSTLKLYSHVDKRDSLSWTPLSYAAYNGHEAVVRLLLEHKADVNVKADDGGTSLYRAAGNGHEAVVRLLVEHKADVDAKAYKGRTALHQAAESGHEAVVRLLVEHKADVDAKADEGRTALHRAAGSGHKAVVRLLQTSPHPAY
jgi:ankyrin repeat protein